MNEREEVEAADETEPLPASGFWIGVSIAAALVGVVAGWVMSWVSIR